MIKNFEFVKRYSSVFCQCSSFINTFENARVLSESVLKYRVNTRVLNILYSSVEEYFQLLLECSQPNLKWCYLKCHNTRVLSLFFLHSSVRMKVLCFWRIETRYSSVEKSILECWSTLSLNTRVLCLKCCLSFENFCPILECWKLALECWQHFLHNSSVCNQVQVF